MDWNWQVIFDHIPDLLNGAVLTVQLVVFSGIIGLFFGLILALLRLSKNWLVQVLPFLYIFFFRGTPLLVQIFLIYYGLGQFEAVRNSFLWEPVLSQAYWCAIIAFTLNYAAYFAEIFRGGIEAIPAGQYEAAKVLKLTQIQTIRYIILPQVFKIVLPSVFNEVINLVKDSSLVYVLGIADLLQESQIASNRDASLIPMFFAGAIYLILIGLVTVISKQVEKKFSYYK